MNAFLLVGLGGAAGSMLRLLCQRTFNNLYFPYGTLAVNVAGCFIIGVLWALFAKNAIQDSTRLLLMTGFCGGFTTFSAFTQEGVQMLTEQRYAPFFIYVLASVTAGLLATFAGYKLFT